MRAILKRRWASAAAVRAAGATLILLLIGGIFSPGSLAPVALLSILPFVAILAVAAIGQHLVIQQRGFDLSVAGIMSFAAVLVTAFASDKAGFWEVSKWVAIALALGAAFGAINGAITAILKVPPLVTTIGTNAALLGLTLYYANGTPSLAPAILTRFSVGRSLGIPNTILVMAVIALLAAFILERTAIGRRFIAVGVNPLTARALAIPVRKYVIGTYVVAGLFFAAAGVMLAGFLNTPTLFCGNDYVLSSVAAVVIGGNSLAGGRGSTAATVIGTFFLTYLGQLVLSLGFASSTQYVIQALAVLAGVAAPSISQQLRVRHLASRSR